MCNCNPWKNASKELPKDKSRVVIALKHGWMDVADYSDKKWFTEDGYWETSKITHWMYIPELPEV